MSLIARNKDTRTRPRKDYEPADDGVPRIVGVKLTPFRSLTTGVEGLHHVEADAESEHET